MTRRRRRTLIGLAVAAVLTALVGVERSPLLALNEVEIVGVDRTDAEEIRDAAALPEGTSTLRLRLGPAADRVEALATIRRATVSRTDALTVRITVEERQPVLAVSGAGTVALVDREGIVVAHDDPGALPVVEIGDLEPPAPDGSVAEDPTVRNAFAVYRALPGPLRADVSTYEAAGPDDVLLVLGGEVRARLGRAERVPEKARVLGALLADLPEDGPWLVDVRAPANPVVVPSGGDGGGGEVDA